ncbi:unnamed protein product [Rotaria sp. Silwood1]|nr:unnamed protein product [Rotaria sp. Silwood1]
MASTVNNDASPTVYRPIERHEYQQAFDLWYTVFKTAPPGFFERYLASEASPRYQINDTLGAWHDDGQLLLKIYSNNPRAYQFDRAPLAMFQHWTGFYWRNDEAIICVLDDDEQGYVVIKKPNHQADVCISEWRAANIDVEKKLLKLAAIEIRRRHPQTKVIRLQGVPQYISLDELRDWTGAVDVERNPDTMFRNLRLPEETFQDVKTAFYSGKAIWWLGDYF